MQLDAFLRSARRYAPYETITPLLRTSTSHVLSYGTCWEENGSGAPWPLDTAPYGSFEESVRAFLLAHERVVFHTDDDVFFRHAEIPEEYWQLASRNLAHTEAVGSLRLGLNTTYCHPLSREQQVPQGSLWEWREADGDFGYPLSLNGTVYFSKDLLPLLPRHFYNPTELEAQLAARAGEFGPEWMTAPLHSCVVSLPHNRVSISSGCPAGANPDWQPDALCQRYLDGWRIDLEAMDFTNIVGAHQEVPLEFKPC